MKKQYWSLLALAAVVLLTVGGFASCSNDDDDDSDSGSTSSSTSVELPASVGTNELAGLTLTRVVGVTYVDGSSGGRDDRRDYIKYVFSDTEMDYYYVETAEDAEAPSFDDRPLCMKYTTLVIPTKKPLLTSAMRHTLTALHTRRQVAI